MMATMSDSAFPPLFQSNQNQSIFSLPQNGSKGLSSIEHAHQQKLMHLQLQQQHHALTNMHFQQLENSSINGTSTPGNSSPQSVQTSHFSADSEGINDNVDPVSSAASPIHINGSYSGTSSLNTSLSGNDLAALNGQETSQNDSLTVPTTVQLSKSPNRQVSPVPVLNLGVTVTSKSGYDGCVPEGNRILYDGNMNNIPMTSNNIMSFSQLPPDDLSAASSTGLGLTRITENALTSNPNMSNISSIWSEPTSVPNDSQGALNEQMLYQALHHQQQLPSWEQPPNMSAYNPGYNNSLASGLLNGPQNSTHQQQLQLLQQQLAIKRSQAMLNQGMYGLQRSTSFQPSTSSLGMTKGPAYSSWSNGHAAVSNNMYNNSAAMRNNSTLFNSLNHSNSPSGRVTTLNGMTPGRKSGIGAQVIAPPKFSRSLSTPAKYNGFNGPQIAPLSSIDDNPFFKIPGDGVSSGNLLSTLQERNPVDTMQMGSIESQLYDILRSESVPGGKWNDLGPDPLFEDGHVSHLGVYDPLSQNLNRISPLFSEFGRERYSRKVFVGGLPPDIDEEEIQASFRHFGPLVVDWPHKAESKSYFPPKGYAFLLFQSESSVQNLINCCLRDDEKLYLRVSSPTIKEKPVQIRPWNLADSDYVLDDSQALDPRKTIFVGGVPRPLRAMELAMIMDRLYGGVCYAGIDVDPELKYPKGAGRVAFSNQQSYIAAISARFVQLQHGDIDKRVEVKPYVLDDQLCDECQGARCGGKFAPFFCANVTCLQYYCEQCWSIIHSRPGRDYHKPLVKEGADRSTRSMPFRW